MTTWLDPQRLEEATRLQREALRVEVSPWVSASAGSGKTQVLTWRLMSLMLADPLLKPCEIMALTFTRAGASEMDVRLGRTLCSWAGLSDSEMEQQVRVTLGVWQPDYAARIRMLAREVVERPPVMTTVHGLAQMMLSAFPLEAGVPVRFSVLEETEVARIVEEIQHTLAVTPHAAFGDHLAILLDEYGEYGWRALTKNIVANWGRLRRILDGRNVPELLLELDRDLKLGDRDAWAKGPLAMTPAEMSAVRAVAAAFGGHALAAALGEAGQVHELRWREALLTKEDTPKKTLLTKEVVKVVGEDTLEILRGAQERIAEQVRLRKLMRMRLVTESFIVWGFAVKAGYDAYKRDLGACDYNDLLDGLERLLERAEDGRAAWVWFALDRKLMHLVVDEAQDNNAQQDRIVRLLMNNLFSGERDTARPRSMMAVGDMKQSIYRFQGAVPDLFAELQGVMQEKSTAMLGVSLQYNFRSGAAVLDAVDQVFSAPGLAREVMGVEMDWLNHVAVHKDRPSRVELWEPCLKAKSAPEDEGWVLPEVRHAALGVREDTLCFEQIAAWIKAHVGKVALPSLGGRMLAAKDIMILPQRNSSVVRLAEVLKRHGIAVVVGGSALSQPVLDVMALLRIIFDRRDTLSLATVLKGFWRWDDAALLALARDAGKGDWVEALAADVRLWLGEFEALRHEPLALVLKALHARGASLDEAEGLLAWAEKAATLAELVARLERDEPKAGNPGGDGVKLMTVHRAKGLQAAVVIVPETLREMGKLSAEEKFVWGERMVAKRESGVSAFVDGLVAREGELLRHDSLRLLYVAMTRACDWLIVTGYGKYADDEAATWWQLVDRAARENGWREENGCRVMGHDFTLAP